jgi:dihydropteroate synthase
VPSSWLVRDDVIALERPLLVAIMNVTPDSFSDGGSLASVDAAVARAEALVREGADVLDVGGESTRPGASPVAAGEETARVLPVIAALARRIPGTPISVDTTKADVARAALDAGATIVNDVSGFRLDPDMPRVCADARAGVILMHSRGAVADMASYADAEYEDVLGEVRAELGQAVTRAIDAGVDRGRIVVDPGIGFAKRGVQSIMLLNHLDRIVTLGFPVMVGASRKRVIGDLTGRPTPADRDHGTVGVHLTALRAGARLFRVHDVRTHRGALDAAWAVMRTPSAAG